MKLILGGFFPNTLAGSPRTLDVPLEAPVGLGELLERLGIPIAEVHLAVINGELVDAATARVAPGDEVKIYPPADGG